MIYDKVKAGRMLRVALEVADAAIDLANHPGGESHVRIPAMEAEKTLRSLAAKGDCDAMYHEYLGLLQADRTIGPTLERYHRKSFESELYRFVKIYWERD